MSPEEAWQGIIETVKFIMANSSHTPSALGDMTWPQVNAIAESIREYRIHAWGIGLGGKKDTPTTDREHTTADAMAFVAQFSGI